MVHRRMGSEKRRNTGVSAMKQYVQIKFVKVKGHSNDKYNDYADMLAKSALGIGDGSFEKKEDQEWIKVR